MPERGHILVILDGMTDGQTGFDSLPELAALARGGLCGTSRNTPAGFPCESYPAIATLLGLGPGQIPPGGRGWLEALGAGVPVQPGDLLLRGSWVRLEQGRAAGYADPPQSLPAVPGVEYYALGGYKALLRLPGAGPLAGRITAAQPYRSMGRPWRELLPAGVPLLEQFAAALHQEKRMLVPWGQSTPGRLPAFGWRGAAVTGTGLVRGLCLALGMEVPAVTGATGDTDTDLHAKAAAALALAEQYPFVLLHLGGADEAAHRRSPEEKRDFLRRAGHLVLAPLGQSGLPLCVCADHSTSPVTGEHSGPVQPFVLAGSRRTALPQLPLEGSRLVTLLMED